jgi:hypothetical protein
MSIERRAHAPTPLESVSRRSFLTGSSALAAAGALGLSDAAAAEPPPETQTIRLPHTPAICLAPQYLAEDLLRLEGFTKIEYVPVKSESAPVYMLANARADVTMDAAVALAFAIGNGSPVTVIGGIHAGCYELFGHQRVKAVRDLKGARVAISGIGGADHVLISSILAYVGMDPGKDVEWRMGKMGDEMTMFAEGKVDAVMCFPPQPQELRARKLGHLVLDTAEDRPWSQDACARRDPDERQHDDPGQADCGIGREGLLQPLAGACVLRRIRIYGVDQQIRIDQNHLRSSSSRAISSSSSAAASLSALVRSTPGWTPPIDTGLTRYGLGRGLSRAASPACSVSLTTCLNGLPDRWASALRAFAMRSSRVSVVRMDATLPL